MTTAQWLGEDFQVLGPPTGEKWNDVPGVYLFVRIDQREQRYAPLYVGQTTSLAARLPGHERWHEAERLGATQVHAKVIQAPGDRARLEENLIRTFNPPLNRQHTP